MRAQETYLRDISERIVRLETISAEGKEAFLKSFILQDAMIRNFEVLGEAVKQLSPGLTAPYPEIPWKSIAGFRNVLIHDYANVNLEIVWKACTEHLAPLKAAVQTILKNLPTEPDSE
jgi:uncharacterized protein with HEPN domain